MANYRHLRRSPIPPDNCMIHDHLYIWSTESATYQVGYLGYPLLLSPAEIRILLYLLSAPKHGRFFMATATMTSLPASTDAGMLSAIAVYTMRINRKSQRIGGRDLIIHDRYYGYRLNPCM